MTGANYFAGHPGAGHGALRQRRNGRLGEHDVAGLLPCKDMYGAPYDLRAAALADPPIHDRGGL